MFPKDPHKVYSWYGKKKRRRTAFIIGKKGVVLECCKNIAIIALLIIFKTWACDPHHKLWKSISGTHIYTIKKSKVIYRQQNNNNNNAYKEYQLSQQFHKNYNKNYKFSCVRLLALFEKRFRTGQNQRWNELFQSVFLTTTHVHVSLFLCYVSLSRGTTFHKLIHLLVTFSLGLNLTGEFLYSFH